MELQDRDDVLDLEDSVVFPGLLALSKSPAPSSWDPQVRSAQGHWGGHQLQVVPGKVPVQTSPSQGEN